MCQNKVKKDIVKTPIKISVSSKSLPPILGIVPQYMYTEEWLSLYKISRLYSVSLFDRLPRCVYIFPACNIQSITNRFTKRRGRERRDNPSAFSPRLPTYVTGCPLHIGHPQHHTIRRLENFMKFKCLAKGRPGCWSSYAKSKVKTSWENTKATNLHSTAYSDLSWYRTEHFAIIDPQNDDPQIESSAESLIDGFWDFDVVKSLVG